jgi:hypothetical protein
MTGANVSFTAKGTCVLDANQAGDANYFAAPQAQQSFAVSDAPTANVPSVSVTAGPASAAEGGLDGAFVFTRTGDTSSALTVTYSTAGSAISGVDFSPLATVVIPAGQPSVTVPVHALADSPDDNGEATTVQLTPNNSYNLGSPESAAVAIVESRPACDKAPISSYTDRADASVHAHNVDCLTAYGLAEGFSDNTYRPALDVSRAEMASFLVRLLANAGVTLPANPPDAYPGDNGGVHELAINQLAALGVLDSTTGQTGDKYNVSDPMRRDDMAQLLFNAFTVITGAPLPPGPNAFTDTGSSDNNAAINALAAAGVVQGTGGGLYAPAGPVSRGQFASFFARYIQLLVDAGNMAPLP